MQQGAEHNSHQDRDQEISDQGRKRKTDDKRKDQHKGSAVTLVQLPCLVCRHLPITDTTPGKLKYRMFNSYS